ncbi:septum formation protein [Granulicella rosea]|uniref:dTTP/UTP pyrophosphatase n=1 Tax=Granulicella rosea TaxID=474952 RepID=A0A239DCS1_9BACT|nr:Maf family protein [Granulicella rosea]SNS30129.1 septum formation protein [Granulicella rosea]
MLILASASPRRRELLTQAGLTFEVQAADLDETPLPDEAAAAYVQRLAVEKAQAVHKLNAHRDTPEDPLIVLAADTTVVVIAETDRILGKPAHAAEAEEMLTLLSGRTHAVMTGVAAVTSQRVCSDVEITQVTFNLIKPDEIAAYVATGHPLDKAGAYGIQGYAARWIPRIEGDYYNVVGLPIARVVALLAEAIAPGVK